MRSFYPRVCLFVVFLACAGKLSAQEVDYSQYYLNMPAMNAGFTGIEGYLDTKLAYRQGWNGFGVTNNDVFLSAYGAIGATGQASLNNSLRISKPDAFAQAQSGQRGRRRQGVGGMVTSRTVGPYTSVSVNGNYAYHLPISTKLTASLGTRVAYGSQRVDFSGLTVRDPVNDMFYQQLQEASPGMQSYLTIDFGAALYSNRFYVGLSTTNLGSKTLTSTTQLTITNQRQYNMQVGTTLPLAEDWAVNVAGRASYIDGYDPIWAGSARIRYKEVIYLGGGFSSAKRLSMMLGIGVTDNLTVNYTYDHFLAGQSTLNVNVHEVIVGISLFTKYESKARMW